jgi:hypothetical protein
MPAAPGPVLPSGARRDLYRKEKLSSGRARMRAKASPPALKRGNSCARRCITSAKGNTAQHLRNRQSPSDSRRPGAQESSFPRRAERRRRPALRRKRKETPAKAKAIPGVNRRLGDPGPRRMLLRRRATPLLPMLLSPDKPELPLAIVERLRDGMRHERQAAHGSRQEPRPYRMTQI